MMAIRLLPILVSRILPMETFVCQRILRPAKWAFNRSVLMKRDLG